MAPLAKGGGPRKKSWVALVVACLFIAGFLTAGGFGAVSGALTDTSSTDTSASSSSGTSDTSPTTTDTTSSSGTTDTTPTSVTTDTTPTTGNTDTTPTTTDTSTTSTTTTTGSSPLSTPAISSDASVYGPGATVTLTGSGWQPGEKVHLFVNDDQGKTWSYSADVTANATGSFTNQFQLPTSFIAVYAVTATGTNNDSATTQFQDDGLIVTFPTATTYSATAWAAGCSTAGFCGTANGGNTASVKVSIRQGTGNYWV